ncbi:trypsin-like peptidase domain-containing protein [Thermosynechococcus sp. PP45]|uniref:serine protease n=1 Tax=unclassified Thermosynechococcus TaxID=2622553 RepID=UPI002671DC11|nr:MULTISPECIES: serine protease [unclassified Thermosynechococcus]WKT80629.1 trypsin-like peptidase domain-containing protein [Thermosynechococcus sp. PP45]WNC24241.1 trypsin-like peptidase domain-containing protein [Thermosynechococcus sp. PP551]WNC26819.1 trypsin-like peptidase domain-containing protein [Thermosynechococcus sp. PP555]
MGRWHSWSLVGMAIATVHIAQPFPAQGVSVTEVARIAKNITVLIEGTNSHGSGILLQRKGSTYVILTAYHVVEKAGQYTVKTVDGQRYAMQPNSIRPLPGVDLATLEIESNRDYTLATLGNSVEAVEGMPVFVAGFPAQEASILGGIYQFTEGRLTANASRPIQDGYALVYSNPTLPGMSGGPVLDENGRLIGVHGSADIASTLVQEGSGSSTVFVKRGFNLGIPINTYLSLTTPSRETTALPAPTPLKAADYFLAAEEHFQRKNFAAAIDNYSQAIALNPNYSEAYLGRAVAQMFALVPHQDFNQLGEELGTKYLSRLTQGNPILKDAFPPHPPTPMLDTFVRNMAERPGTIQQDIAKAIALNPQYTEAYGIRSFLNLLLGNFGTAVADSDRALALSPNNSDLQMIQSLALFLSGDFRRSIPVFDRLITANPKSTDYHLLRGIAAFLMGDYALSRPSWTALTQLTPKDPIPFAVRGVTYLLEQNPKASLPDLRQAAELYRQQGNMQSYNEMMEAIRQIENR